MTGVSRSLSTDRVQVTLEPSLHWSARACPIASWRCGATSSWRVLRQDLRLRDTGYDPQSIFPAMRAQYGPFVMALLPIGAYEPRWFMAEQHMNPEEAVKVMQELGAENAIGTTGALSGSPTRALNARATI